VRVNGRGANAKAHLDSTALTTSGAVRLRVPFGEMRGIEARDGGLHFTWYEDRVTLELDAGVAEKWAHAILHPKSRLEKLGVKAGLRVCALGCDADFVAELAAALGDPPATHLRGDFDLVFYGVAEIAGLARIPALVAHLKPAGALWLTYAKGRGAPVPESAVRAALLGAGLVDTKVAAFSPAHTAVKAVIPVASRISKSR